MSASRHRTAFIVGVLVGGSAGVAAAFLSAPQSGRRTRDQIQQSAERVIFKVLDMIPYQHVAADLVTSSRAAGAANGSQAPVDVVLASRPSEMGMNQPS